MHSLVFVGIRGHVVALDRATGSERWRTRLKGSGAVLLIQDGGQLVATTGGSAFCPDGTTGAIVWSNPLRGLGFGIATLAGGTQAGAESALVAAAAARAAATSAAG